MADGDDHETDFTYNEDDVVEGTADHEEGLVDEGDDLLDGTVDTENGEGDDTTIDDPELEAIKERVREMEEEAEKLKEMQSEVDRQMNLSSSSLGSPTAPSMEDKLDADFRSIWVGNVDYGATAEELEAHFHGCGSINRVTILCDKFSGHPKGFAYVEFTDKDSVQTAEALDDSLFRGRQIKVTAKRTNRPGISTTNRQPRGRFRRPSRFSSYSTGYVPRSRSRFRPRRASSYYAPY